MGKTCPQASATFLEDLRSQNYSPATLRRYEGILDLFSAHLKRSEVCDLQDLDEATVRAFILHVHGLRRRRDGGEASMSNRRQTLWVTGKFLSFLADHGDLPRDFSPLFAGMRRVEVLPRRVLTEAEIEVICRAVPIKTHLGFRDRVIIETLYGTGIRRSELVGLAVDHVDFKGCQLFIRQGKGRRDRFALFGEVLRGWLWEYVTRVRPVLAANRPEETALFISKDGGGIGIPALAARLRKYSKATGIPFSAHAFRHAFATHLLKNGASILYIKELLGHRRLTTSEVYTRVYPVDLKRLIEAHHPRFHAPEKAASLQKSTPGREGEV